MKTIDDIEAARRMGISITEFRMLREEHPRRLQRRADEAAEKVASDAGDLPTPNPYTGNRR